MWAPVWFTPNSDVTLGESGFLEPRTKNFQEERRLLRVVVLWDPEPQALSPVWIGGEGDRQYQYNTGHLAPHSLAQ